VSVTIILILAFEVFIMTITFVSVSSDPQCRPDGHPIGQEAQVSQQIFKYKNYCYSGLHGCKQVVAT
jgi:hypothetical protein